MFNTWKNTFYDVCGPFIYKDNRWFPVYAKKYSDAVILAQENLIIEQQKMLFKNLCNIHIEIEKQEKEIFENYGL